LPKPTINNYTQSYKRKSIILSLLKARTFILPIAKPLATNPLLNAFIKAKRRLINTSCNKVIPNKTTSSDRKISITKADVHTSSISRPDNQNANECKTKYQIFLDNLFNKKKSNQPITSANIFGKVRVE
jgi:hypothetical protein